MHLLGLQWTTTEHIHFGSLHVYTPSETLHIDPTKVCVCVCVCARARARRVRTYASCEHTVPLIR
jgi:hypothetical protein